jgi:hypothetical protein
VLWEYVLFELQLFENFQQQDGGCDPKGMWCWIITVITFPPVFFINSLFASYSLSNNTFIVTREQILLELWLFERIFNGT